MVTENTNMSGWTEWSKYVLLTIDKLVVDIDNLQKQIEAHKQQTAENKEELTKLITELTILISNISTAMKVRNAIFGTIGGLIGGGLITLILKLII